MFSTRTRACAARPISPETQSMLWETSLLDAEEGIRFRGYNIPELQVRSLAV
jgi:hypothetical protein